MYVIKKKKTFVPFFSSSHREDSIASTKKSHSEEKFLGAGRVPHTWHPVDDSNRPNVFWMVRILKREKMRESGGVRGGEKEGINMPRPKHVLTVEITDEYRYVVLARHPKKLSTVRQSDK